MSEIEYTEPEVVLEEYLEHLNGLTKVINNLLEEHRALITHALGHRKLIALADELKAQGQNPLGILRQKLEGLRTDSD